MLRLRPRLIVTIGSLAILVAVSAACGPAAETAPSAGPSATASPLSTAASASPEPSIAASTSIDPTPSPAPSKGPPATVDLAFTGTLVFVAKGVGGSCDLATGSDGAMDFRFEASDVDFPGLGSSFKVTESPRDTFTIDWVVDPNRSFDAVVQTTAFTDGESVRIELDADLVGSGPEHVKGTIVCS